MREIDVYVQNKKVLLLGFGREGRSTYAALRKNRTYQELAIADIAPRPSGVLAADTKYITGKDYQQAIYDYDLVFKSPGVVLEQDISHYPAEITSQTEVFLQLFRAQIVGITGTKGKSTTSTLLYHTLKAAGRPVILVGNIGTPCFDHLENIGAKTLIVFELSCHQLEYLSVSPAVGVLLNVHEEHLDHYQTMERYVAAKENIFNHQKAGDVLICSRQCCPDLTRIKGRLISASVLEDGEVPVLSENEVMLAGETVCWGDERFVIPAAKIQLKGSHNYFDAAVVFVLGRMFGLTHEEIMSGLISYQPLPHRLAYLGEKDGVKYYDDSISTICDTTIQALNTLTDADTVLIGGMDRGIAYDDLIAYLSECAIPNIILMEETGMRIYQEIKLNYPGFKGIERLIFVHHLDEAVKEAKIRTRRGKSCVLSPAAASYGIFKNFEERGDVFKQLVFSSQ